MAQPRHGTDNIESLLQAATGLIPLLDQTIMRIRYSQSLPGISPLEYRIMDYVCYHSPVRIGDIGAMSGLSFPNASRYVKDLIGKEILCSNRDPADGRAQLISTTARGQELLKQTEATIFAQASQALSRLTPVQRQKLEKTCRALIHDLTPLARIMSLTP